MLCSAVENYIKTAKGLPFFYVVGDDVYCATLEELVQHGLEVVRTSDFCSRDDKFPNMDDIIDSFRTSDINYKSNKFVIIGLGEYLALRGDAYAERELRRLKDTTLGTSRVIILLRCVTPQITNIAKEDFRLEKQNRIVIMPNAFSNIQVTNIKLDINNVVQKGIRGLLSSLEDGKTNLLSSTELNCDSSLIPISNISTAYGVIKYFIKPFLLPENLGTNAQWGQLLQDLFVCKNSLSLVMQKYGLGGDFEEDIYEKISGYEYKNWLYFLSLKWYCEKVNNQYLRYVINNTNCYEDLKNNIIVSIVNILRTDKNFNVYYKERKKLVRNFSESDIALFLKENSICPEESIFRYTDNTLIERKAIIKWVSKYGFINEINDIYPALGMYLKKYHFTCGKVSDKLTAYFDDYKKQKLTNQVRPDFIKLVEEYAGKCLYANLDTRDNVITSIPDKGSTYLYWIDALGVEYLSYIQELARLKGLSIKVEIVRADLPTVTAVNRSFFDGWQGEKKYKEDELDNLKHKENKSFIKLEEEGAGYLANELMVIERAINTAASQLALHNCKAVVLASDHGASRLAVLCQGEEEYETDTKGEHSGRCCKLYPEYEYDNPYVIAEKDYLVSANYGKFQGGRSATIEVHGGATLEEVVIPVVTIKLKKQSDIKIVVLNKDKIFSDRHDGTTITIYISDVDKPNKISLMIGDQRYLGIGIDKFHFKFNLFDIKRSKKGCCADIYDSDNLIGTITFDIKGKAASVNSEFDDFD